MSKGFALIVSSLHHYLAGHLRMNRTEVRVGARLGEGERELFVGIHYFGLEDTVCADCCMGDVISISPRYGSPNRNGQRRRSEAEVVDLDRRAFGFRLSSCY